MLQSTEDVTLTASGLGAVLQNGQWADTAELASLARSTATRTGSVLVQDLDLSEDVFKELIHGLGDPVEHKYSTGQSDLMKLNATREKGKVVIGRGPLPLHTDGILLGSQVDLIILYAAEFADEPGSGETFLCDQLAAWREMPDALRQVIDTQTFEYLIEEKSHYENAPVDWYPISTTRDFGRVRSLNLALQFPPDSERSWSTRIAGVGVEESDAILDELEAHFSQERYMYRHRWSVGDLLVFDNQRTLRGRTAISDNGVRVLFRGQVVVPNDDYLTI